MGSAYFSKQMLFHVEAPKPYVRPKEYLIPSNKIRLTDEQIKSFENIYNNNENNEIKKILFESRNHQDISINIPS